MEDYLPIIKITLRLAGSKYSFLKKKKKEKKPRSSFTVVLPEYNWIQVIFHHSSGVVSLIQAHDPEGQHHEKKNLK